jgi:enoyl-CoA hydratase/carnithine racemase
MYLSIGGAVEYTQIQYETDGMVATITLDRPERLNAWTPRMSREMWHAIERSNEDASLGAILVTGAGRGFCAGADIGGFHDQIEEQEELTPSGDWVDLCRRSKPLLAAVNGPCVGVGMTMILPFDLIVASERARFGMFFIKMGLVPELASTHFLVQRVGFAKASELCLSGRLYSAGELAGMGLFNGLVPPDELLPRANELAREIACNPDPQLRMIKDLLSRNGTEPDLKAVQSREMELLNRCYETPEHREAVKAFMERRQPRFR